MPSCINNETQMMDWMYKKNTKNAMMGCRRWSMTLSECYNGWQICMIWGAVIFSVNRCVVERDKPKWNQFIEYVCILSEWLENLYFPVWMCSDNK